MFFVYVIFTLVITAMVLAVNSIATNELVTILAVIAQAIVFVMKFCNFLHFRYGFYVIKKKKTYLILKCRLINPHP